MTIATFFILCWTIIMALVGVPSIALFFLYRKYGDHLPGKIAAVAWVTAISYVVLFVSYAGDLVPDSYKLEAKQVYQCDWKTVYVENNK